MKSLNKGLRIKNKRCNSQSQFFKINSLKTHRLQTLMVRSSARKTLNNRKKYVIFSQISKYGVLVFSIFFNGFLKIQIVDM